MVLLDHTPISQEFKKINYLHQKPIFSKPFYLSNSALLTAVSGLDIGRKHGKTNKTLKNQCIPLIDLP